jgi:hypothetical protein
MGQYSREKVVWKGNVPLILEKIFKLVLEGFIFASAEDSVQVPFVLACRGLFTVVAMLAEDDSHGWVFVDEFGGGNKVGVYGRRLWSLSGRPRRLLTGDI